MDQVLQSCSPLSLPVRLHPGLQLPAEVLNEVAQRNDAFLAMLPSLYFSTHNTIHTWSRGRRPRNTRSSQRLNVIKKGREFPGDSGKILQSLLEGRRGDAPTL